MIDKNSDLVIKASKYSKASQKELNLNFNPNINEIVKNKLFISKR